MAVQIRVYANQAPRAAISEYLSESQQKKLKKKGKLVITCDGNRHKTGQMRQDLKAVYVS